MEIKRTLIALALAAAVLFGFDYFVPKPADKTPPAATKMVDAKSGDKASAGAQSAMGVAAPAVAPSGPARRVAFTSPAMTGSVSLRGARIDDVSLTQYRETLDKNSPHVRLLESADGKRPGFIEIGWRQAPGEALKLPNAQTEWTGDSSRLDPDHPLTLHWDNGAGLVFSIKISLSRKYLFSIAQSVENNTGHAVSVVPFTRTERDYKPDDEGSFIVHEGPIAVVNDRLNEGSYKDMRKGTANPDHVSWAADSHGGWAGITDKYWLTAAIPDQKDDVAVRYQFQGEEEGGEYAVDVAAAHPVIIAAHQSGLRSSAVFVGAKEVTLLDDYTNQLHIPYFYKAVDFGWFAFLTRPMFHVLHWLFGLVGNFGIALLIMTLIIKVILYPLATKSFASMARMRVLAPKIQAIRESSKDDQMAMNQKIMTLYKEEGVNPAGGCLPLLVQAPVAFCLYKVLNITIEMRHAPFFGWVRDLSAPDPTNIFNLFGLIPFNPTMITPMLQVGIWPLLFGITIWLMQKQSTVTMDPTQQRVMQFMPVLYTFLLGRLSAGIVIYYTWNNILSYFQQRIIQARVDAAAKRGKRVKTGKK
ncbi:membrane protein insertase YidC [Candidatus Kirkpatrickella diaphorinae]|uniref:Membrane protein insertase YidC n=2 Tax=Candidatus Kirkpatrickella diaphorinae TaxID=2984322 RepID=A0ABY6GLM0_9PROT|nr:membrane protein insertase YidC [Candidatus Kirkpatrickella diaphorinae]